MSRSETRWQTILLCLGYGVAFTVFASGFASVSGVICAGIGAVGGVALHRWQVEQSLRNTVPGLIGSAFLVFGLWAPAWMGRVGWVPALLGISTTLILIQSISLAIASAGIVMLIRSLSQGWRVFSMIDGLVMIAAICGRFAAHRNYRWGHPRFLADWAGIEGYELPFLFVLLGLGALLTGLIAGMRRTGGRHAVGSVLTVLLFLALLMWIGGRILRNPTPEIVAVSGETAGGSTSGTGSGENGSGNEGQDSASSDASSGSSQSDGGSGKGAQAESGETVADDRSRSASGRGGNIKRQSQDPLPSATSQSTTPRPIALVLLEKDIQPVEHYWYFRQTAVSLFNGKRLVTASESRFDDDIPGGFSGDEVFIGGIPLPENMHEIIPLVVNLMVDQPRPFSLPSMISFSPMRNPNPEYFRQSYRAESCVLTDETVDGETYGLYSSLCYFAGGSEEWDEALFEHYTLGPDDPRYQELAESIIAERITAVAYEGLEDSPMLKALAIKRWLEKNTTYSHDPRFDDPSVNPAEQFLFGERSGYCVHISHASVYLMRSLGIPARIGTGYMVPSERNGKSSSILIQSTDAHAWAEIYLDGAGWVVVDASPEKIDETTVIPREPDPTVAQFLADRARNKDQHRRRAQPKSQARGFPLSARQIPWVVLAAIVSLYLVKFWIRWCPSFIGYQDLVRLTHRATVLHLAEIGVQREFGETRTEFGQRVAETFPEFAEFTAVHIREAYGRSLETSRSECLATLEKTRQRTRQVAGWFRWSIGCLDPRFWKLVR